MTEENYLKGIYHLTVVYQVSTNAIIAEMMDTKRPP
jgi:Mn-dependent DtxR family transcriptional regulator